MRYNLAIAILAVMPTLAFAQSSVTMAPPKLELMESYRAYIGRDDLFNSSGARLTKPWEILRQDRANFHQYGTKQMNEDGDSFFANVDNRARMEAMVQNGFTSMQAGDAIVGGLVWVNVEILGSNGVGRAVRISVER
jgi:hypothetical protein